MQLLRIFSFPRVVEWPCPDNSQPRQLSRPQLYEERRTPDERERCRRVVVLDEAAGRETGRRGEAGEHRLQPQRQQQLVHAGCHHARLVGELAQLSGLGSEARQGKQAMHMSARLPACFALSPFDVEPLQRY